MGILLDNQKRLEELERRVSALEAQLALGVWERFVQWCKDLFNI